MQRFKKFTQTNSPFKHPGASAKTGRFVYGPTISNAGWHRAELAAEINCLSTARGASVSWAVVTIQGRAAAARQAGFYLP